MRRILLKSFNDTSKSMINNGSKKLISRFSTKKTIQLSPDIQKAMQFQFKLRCITKPQQLYNYILQNKQDLKKYGKTIFMDYLNEYPMQSFLRSRQQVDAQHRQMKRQIRFNVYKFLADLQNLNDYQVFLRYAIYNKVIKFIGFNDYIHTKRLQAQKQIHQIFKSERIDLPDAINWLYLLSLIHTEQQLLQGLQIVDRQLDKPQNIQYLQNNRGISILFKRIVQADWVKLRKFKNIIKFITYHAQFQQQQSFQQLIIMFERILSLKLHLLGQKTIPKIVDSIFRRIQDNFDIIKDNKHLILKIFNCFKYLPLNYNRSLFSRIHNYLKMAKDLPSHLLIYLPYGKLSVNEISFLQNKMFIDGRQDISLKLIYTVYSPNYKQIFTPLLTKQAYNNMFQIYRKQGVQYIGSYQVYFALIFRFMKMKSNIIDQEKIGRLVKSIIQNAEKVNFHFVHTFSFSAMIALFQVINHFGINTKYSQLMKRLQDMIRSKKYKNSTLIFNEMVIQALRVHYNTNSTRSKDLLTSFIHHILDNSQTLFKQKCQVLFLIKKAQNTDPRWQKILLRMRGQIQQNIQAFVQQYIKYDFKTLKLTNYICLILNAKQVSFTVISQLTSSLNLKLLTSLKGKLLSPLKQYFTNFDYSSFSLSSTNLNSLIQTYRLLYNFRRQIQQFMQFFSIKLIEQISCRTVQQKHINGKQFTSLCIYLMQVIKNMQIDEKSRIIQLVVNILKQLRKKQGIYLKVFEFNFIMNNLSYITHSPQNLSHKSRQIIQTLNKTQRIQHHKQLYLIILKLHCLDYLSLSNLNIRIFIDHCIQMITQSYLTLNQVKQCLGYEILNCNNQQQIEKIKLIIRDIVKLSLRKQNQKQNYFVYEYFLRLFDKLGEKQIIIQILDNILYQKLYPVQLSNIIPILNNNNIKIQRFNIRILQIIKLSQSYITYQKIQTLSWLQKINYQLKNNPILNKIIQSYEEQIILKTNNMKQQLKDKLVVEERNLEDGYEVLDENFQNNYKKFVDFAWIALKNKLVNSLHFKFICRYIFFNLEKIREKLQSTQLNNNMSRIKIYHLLKFIKACEFFSVQKGQNIFIKQDQPKQTTRKKKLNLLATLQKDLMYMQLQRSQQLQNKLNLLSDKLTFKPLNRTFNQKKYTKVQYLITHEINKYKHNQQFVIHTVKDYHRTATDIDLHPEKVSRFNTTSFNNNKYQQQSMSKKQLQSQQQLLFKQDQQFSLQQSSLSLQLQPDKQSPLQKDHRQKYQQNIPKQQLKPLFGNKKQKISSSKILNQLKQKQLLNKINPKIVESLNNGNKKNIFNKKQSKTQNSQIKQSLKVDEYFIKLLQIKSFDKEPVLYKDYNGYLKIEKSIIELVTGMPCVIYDEKTGLFME